MLPFGVLTADRNTQSRGGLGVTMRYAVAVDIIYKGALVSVNAAGFLVAASDTAGEQCVGVADENVDNSGGSAGDLWCRVVSGRAFRVAATSILQTDVGTMAYVVDDQTIEVAAATTNDIPVGYIVELVSAAIAWVFIPAGGYNAT